jgi:hypothetical protein
MGPTSPFSNELINVQATVEADADRDGFGDETQDACPASAGPNRGCPVKTVATQGTATVDKTKPSLGSLGFSSSVFKAAASGGSTSAKKESSAPTGPRPDRRQGAEARQLPARRTGHRQGQERLLDQAQGFRIVK